MNFRVIGEDFQPRKVKARVPASGGDPVRDHTECNMLTYKKIKTIFTVKKFIRNWLLFDSKFD